MNTQPAGNNVERETRIFFWFLTLMLAGMGVWVIFYHPEIRRPLPLVAFIGLMSVHILLHWGLRRFANSPRWLYGYVIGQGAIAVTLNLMVRDIGLSFALPLALVGETIGVYGLSTYGKATSLFYLALSLSFYLRAAGLAQAGFWLFVSVPSVLFIIIYVTFYSRQVSANERARELLADLGAANRQLSSYAAQVKELTITAERQRMARELHDTLSQGLAGLVLQLEAADAHLANGRTEKARRIVQQTMENARVTLAGARAAIGDLRAEEPLELAERVRRAAARFQADGAVACGVELELTRTVAPALAEVVERILSEALTNIARHAQASQARVTVKSGAGGLSLEVSDDGVGFDPAAVSAGHYGLVGMDERARMAGGELELQSAPGRGTRIRARFPLP